MPECPRRLWRNYALQAATRCLRAGSTLPGSYLASHSNPCPNKSEAALDIYHCGCPSRIMPALPVKAAINPCRRLEVDVNECEDIRSGPFDDHRV
jgi:hypothetical protein